jgi:hypothetical protein
LGLLAVFNSRIASVIHNNLARRVTLGTARGSRIKPIVGITLRTSQCTGGRTHFILLTILDTSKANVSQNGLVRGIT